MSFSDIFKSKFLDNFASVSLMDMGIAMVLAFGLGLFIHLVYKKTYNGVMYSSGFSLTLVALTMITTLVILAVTSNVVLSLGMVGALSIVRFRAAIKEPTDIAFLFWAIAVGIVLYAAIGITLGSLAGWLGGWVDAALMRTTEFVLALPALYLILALRAVLPLEMPYFQTAFIAVSVIALVAWPPMARGVRGILLQLRNAGYVEAARGLGCTRRQIFARHMLPAMLRFISAQAVAAAPVFLLGEVTLSFLGVGFQDSAASWGSMLRGLKDPRVLTDFWWNLAPLFMVFLTLFGLHLISRQWGETEAPATSGRARQVGYRRSAISCPGVNRCRR